jgi:hypothetical protein
MVTGMSGPIGGLTGRALAGRYDVRALNRQRVIRTLHRSGDFEQYWETYLACALMIATFLSCTRKRFSN